MDKPNRLTVLAVTLVIAAVAGIVSPISLAGTSFNGTSLNGASLNGTNLNGMSLNGLKAENGMRAGTRLQANDQRKSQATDPGMVLRELGQRAIGTRNPLK